MTCAATLSQINQVKCFSTVCLIQLEMRETVVIDSMSLHSTGYEEEDYRAQCALAAAVTIHNR